MSQRFNEFKEKLLAQFAALSEREQRLVGVTALVAIVFIFGGGFMLMQSSLKNKEKQIKAQNEQLGQILALESDYNASKNAQREEMKRLEGKNISLFSLLQNSASELGLSLKDLNEKKSPIKDSEMVQVSVDVNLKEVSIDKLTGFLESSESKSGKGLVKVTRLKTKTRFDPKRAATTRSPI